MIQLIRVKSYLILVIVILSSSCDLTPRLYKDILRAQELISERKYVEAINQYEVTVVKSTNDNIRIKIYYQLAELYAIHIGDYKKSSIYYNLIKKHSIDPLWLIKAEEKLGEINYTFLKNYTEALQNYKNLTSFEPRLNSYDQYEFRLGLTYQKLDIYLSAAKVFSNIQKSKKHKYHLKSIYQLGLLSFEQKKWQEAITYWSEYIQKETRKDATVQTKFLMANAYETMELLKKAYNIYYSILGEYPNTIVVKNRLESIYNRRISRKR